MEQLLRTIIEGVSNNYGEAFFQNIVISLRQVIGADYTFIARLDRQRHTGRTIALATSQGIAENIEYDLQYTPCDNVADDSVCLYPEAIQSIFPEDQLLIDMGIEGYIGTPLHDSQGAVMGLTVALYCRPIENAQLVQALFEVFSGRISAEIERMEYAAQLEIMVAQRTQHLEEALNNLRQTQTQLIMQEKLASLGGVVAGVAHEINTPLGIAKTANSYHQDEVLKIREEFLSQKLTASRLKSYLEDSLGASEQISSNLERAVDLVQNFKCAAVERIDESIHEHKIVDLIQHLKVAMNAEFRRNHIFFHSQIDESLTAHLHAGDFTQVLSNLLMNASVHGFTDQHHEERHVSISASAGSDGMIVVDVSDNGVGVDPGIRHNIFEPFVTSKRHEGSTGLGLSIVYNLVTSRLNGSIELLDTKVGCTWRLRIPTDSHAEKAALLPEQKQA